MIDLRHYVEENDGYQWILVGLDSFSKYTWTIPLLNKSSETVTSAIEDIICVFGPSLILHTDNGREFINERMVRLCEKYSFIHVRGRARCPLIQGQVERLNQTLKFSISSKCESLGIGRRWIDVLRGVTYNYNNVVHATTRKKPMDVIFGMDPRITLENAYDNDIVVEMMNQINNWDIEDRNISRSENSVYERWMLGTNEIRRDALINKQISMDIMVRRFMCQMMSQFLK